MFVERQEWSGRVALVTGGSRGIGRAIAIELAQVGMRVAINYRGNHAAAEETLAAVSSVGGEAMLVPADVSDFTAAQAMVETVVKAWGRLDVLVNNAGIARDTLLLRMRPEDWETVLATNLGGAYACTRAATKPMMKQRFGRIVNISSVSGMIGNPGQANYAAAKAGIIGFSRSVARELASRNITVNVVAPGLIATEMTHNMPETAYEQLMQQIPLGRIGRPEDVSQAVWFFIKSDYVTGQTLVVDGGMVMD